MIIDQYQPLVSILVPCYNHRGFVAEAILSALNQTYANIELIVIDDGSTDGTWEEVEKLLSARKFMAIRRENRGLIKTLKELRSLARGEYITILASDDRFYPNKIEIMLNVLRKNPSAGLCVGHADRIDESSNVLQSVRGEYDGNGDLYDLLLNGDIYVPYVATLVKTKAYNQVEFINQYVEDLPAWLQISRDWPVVSVKDVVASHRQVSGSMSQNSLRMIHETKKIINHFTGGTLPYPSGWCVKWLVAYMMFSYRNALRFFFSKKCSPRVMLTIYFYKGLLSSALSRILNLCKFK